MSDFETLTDAEVLERTRRLRARERANTAALVAHLVEVERRGLFAEAGYPSMFKYLVGALGYPEDAAYKRARIARLVRDVPVVLEHLADGRLHLSGAVVLAPLLTSGDAAALLDRAAGRSRRELERLVADLAPKPAPATQVRRLAQAPVAANVAPGLAFDGEVSPRGGTSAHGVSPRGENRSASEVAAASGLPVSQRCESGSEPGDVGARQGGVDGLAFSPRGEGRSAQDPGVGRGGAPCGVAVSPRGGSTCAVEASPDRGRLDLPQPIVSSGGTASAAPDVVDLPPAPAPRRLPMKTEPLGRELYRVAFNASEATLGKIRQLVALMSHQVPSGDLGECLDRALDVAIGRLERERFGSPRARRAEAATTEAVPNKPAPRTRHVPAATRRAVYERDGGRCAYIAPDGRRCAESGWLEIHHAGVPFALGGEHELDNLALFCRAHNQWAGRKVFGERAARSSARSDSS